MFSSLRLTKRFPALIVAALSFLVFASAISAQNTGGVKGKVRTTSGSGIAGATVTARQNGKDTKTVKADSKGNFLVDGLETGRYNIVFEAPGYSSGVLYNVEIQKKKIADLGDRLMLTRDQGEQIIVKGSVFFKEGHSVTGAKVEVEKVNSDGTTKRLGSTYTNISGEFTFRPAEASKLRITATYKGVSGTKEIEVSDPAIYRLAISLNLSIAEK
jgi:Carboxypeptidase regulatory-like domain